MTSGDPGGTNSIFSAILVEEMQCLPVERRPIFCSKLRERKREKEKEKERERKRERKKEKERERE